MFIRLCEDEVWKLIYVIFRLENNLRIFDGQILRKIFGPVDIGTMWRIRNNMEIDKLT